MIPPIGCPTSESFACPKFTGFPANANSGFGGELKARPKSGPEGCVAVYKLAVESARPGRLKAFDVLAFSVEMSRLPGH